MNAHGACQGHNEIAFACTAARAGARTMTKTPPSLDMARRTREKYSCATDQTVRGCVTLLRAGCARMPEQARQHMCQ